MRPDTTTIYPRCRDVGESSSSLKYGNYWSDCIGGSLLIWREIAVHILVKLFYKSYQLLSFLFNMLIELLI